MNWLKVLVGISAILIAGCAAFFSITGLSILFSGASLSVMIMAASLEFAKLVTATYLKQLWGTIKGFNKWYLTGAVIILMLITSAGIFGYLSNAFQQQNIKLEQVQREIDVYNNRITVNNQQINNLTLQITNLQSNQGKIIDNGKVNNRLLRSVDDRDKEVSLVSIKISTLQKDNVNSNDSINLIKNKNIGIEREVGGFRFVADAFGVDLKKVVKFFIIIIVFVFDPLAIALVIAFNQLIMEKKKPEEGIDAIIDDGGIANTNENLKNFIYETSRLRLSENDLKILEEKLTNLSKPNKNLMKAAETYKDTSFEDQILKEEAERFENNGFTESDMEPIISQIVKQHEDEKKIVFDSSVFESPGVPVMEQDHHFETSDPSTWFPDEKEISIVEPTPEEEEINQSSMLLKDEFDGFVPEPFATPEEVEKYHIDEPNPNVWTPQVEDQYWK